MIEFDSNSVLKIVGIVGAITSTGVFSYLFSLVNRLLKLKVSEHQREEVSSVIERIVLSVEQTYVKAAKKNLDKDGKPVKLTGKQSKEALRRAFDGAFGELAKMRKSNGVADKLIRDNEALRTWIEQRVSWVFTR